MKLTKDTLIEGKVIKEGTDVKVVKVKEGLTDLDYAIQAQKHIEDGLNYIEAFVKEGKIEKKHEFALKNVLQALSYIR